MKKQFLFFLPLWLVVIQNCISQNQKQFEFGARYKIVYKQKFSETTSPRYGTCSTFTVGRKKGLWCKKMKIEDKRIVISFYNIEDKSLKLSNLHNNKLFLDYSQPYAISLADSTLSNSNDVTSELDKEKDILKQTCNINSLDNNSDFIYNFDSNDYLVYWKHVGFVGACILPLKMRFDFNAPSNISPLPVTAEGNINISFYAGYKWARIRRLGKIETEFSQTFGAFLGPSIVKVTKLNTRLQVGDNFDLPALTYGLGYGVTYKNIGLNIGVGFDSLFGDVGRKWIYNELPYLVLGVGYNISILKS